MPEISIGQRWADRNGDVFKIIARNKGNERYPFRAENVINPLDFRNYTKNGRGRIGGETVIDLVTQTGFDYIPNRIKIEVGKYYKLSSGKIVGPVTANPNDYDRDKMPFLVSGSKYTKDGRYYPFRSSGYDLIEEVPNPNAPKVEKTKSEEITFQNVPIGATVKLSVLDDNMTTTQEPVTVLKIRVQSFTAEDGRTIVFEPLPKSAMPFSMSHSVKIDNVIVGFVSEFNRVDERLAETFLRLFPYRNRAGASQ